MRKIALLGLFLLVSHTVSVEAGDIYQWTDSSGAVHFTDNPMIVPPEFREKGKRKVEPLKTYAGESGVPDSSFETFSDREMWQARCAECHSTGADGGGLIGLNKFVMNMKTGLPRELRDIIPPLATATNNTHSDMDSLQGLTGKELEQIAKHLLSENL